MASSKSTTSWLQTKTVGKLYVPAKPRTSVEPVRDALDKSERIISDLDRAGPGALELLYLFDQIEQDLHALGEQDADLRVEMSRFEAIQGQLRRRRRRFLNQVGQGLVEERQQVAAPRSRWWWYLDDAAARDRRRTWVRVVAGVAAAGLVLTGAWLAYGRFLAPPPEVRMAFRRIEAGKFQVEEGDTRQALAEFDAATQLMPEDPEAWLWRGVLHDQLGEQADAQSAFKAAESLYETDFNFILNRARIYLESGNVESAQADVEAARALDPTSGWVYYLRAGVAARTGNYDAAVDDLQRAAELADTDGNTRLQGMATTQRAQLMRMLPIQTPQ